MSALLNISVSFHTVCVEFNCCCIRKCNWTVLCVTLVFHQGTHVAISHLYCNCVTICDFSLCQSSLIKASLSDNEVHWRSRSLTVMRTRTLKYLSYMLFTMLWDQWHFKQYLKMHSSLSKLESREPKCSLTLACCGLQYPMQCIWSSFRPPFNAHRFEVSEFSV